MTRVDYGETNTPRTELTRLAAQVYSALSRFGFAGFSRREWADGQPGQPSTLRKYWQRFRAGLADHQVPHTSYVDVCPVAQVVVGYVRLDPGAWAWQALEGGLVCYGCGDLFRPSPDQIEAARCHSLVWCERCCK